MGLIQFATILGALTVGIFAKRMQVKTIWHWILLMSVMLVLMSLSVSPVMLKTGFWLPFTLFMLFLVLTAAAVTILSIFVVSRIQANTPGEYLGKVMAIVQAVAQCVAPIGQFSYGIAFQVFRDAVYIPILLAGGILVLIALAGKAMLKNEG
jgi:hypothetical protein